MIMLFLVGILTFNSKAFGKGSSELSLEAAQRLISKDKAKQALSHLTKIPKADPNYSLKLLLELEALERVALQEANSTLTWRRYLSRLEELQQTDVFERGNRLAELQRARAHCQIGHQLLNQSGVKQNIKTARSSLEHCFELLSEPKTIFFIQAAPVLSYLKECKQRPDWICRSWLQQIKISLPQYSDLKKELDQKTDSWIGFLEKPKGGGVKGTSQSSISYKAPDLDLTAFDEAFTAWSTKDWSLAQKLFQELITNYPRSAHKTRSLFYLAMAQDAAGKKEESQAVFESLARGYPFSFHGVMAAKKLNKNPLEFLDPAAPPLDWELIQAPLKVNDRLHLQRAQKAIKIGAFAVAKRQLRSMRLRPNLSLSEILGLAQVSQDGKHHLGGFQFLGEYLQRMQGETKSKSLLSLIFPFEPLEGFKLKNIGLDPLLLLSLIKQESAFDEMAISSSGALGLMQLMPNTALELKGSLNGFDLFVPQENIAIGSQYLKGLLNSFKGNIALSLAAYNAGPTAVKRWINKSEYEILEFLERIPYKETREYVSSIIRNYYWYYILSHQNQEGSVLPELDFFWKTTTTAQNENA